MTRPLPNTVSLLLADVDGTLVTKEKVLTKRARQAISDLQSKRIRFAMTSGRPPKGMAMLIEPLAVSLPIAGFNGGLFVNPDMSIIESHTLDPVVARYAASEIEQQGLDVWIYAGEEWLIRDKLAPHVSREQNTVQFQPRVVDKFDFNDVVKIVGVSDDLALVARCEAQLKSALGDRASAARSQPYYLDVTNASANKGAVVNFFARTLSISTDEIVTIGDMPNDVLMFKPSGFSIAMGNASREVQKEADAVTDTFENEGFAKAIERFLLVR